MGLDQSSVIYKPFPAVFGWRGLFVLQQRRFRKSPEGLYQIYTYSDPNVGATIDVMNGTPDYIRQAQLSQEELDGYILSTFGAATALLGMLTDKS